MTSLNPDSFYLTVIPNSWFDPRILGTSQRLVCARFRSQTHCSQRQLVIKGAWTPQWLELGQNTQAAIDLIKTLYSLLHCNRSNNRQSWAASQDFGQPKNFEDQCESHPKFKTLQTLLWDLAAVGREPCFFFQQNEQRKTNSQFRLNSATFKL